jgi:WD40-like Beta Propeller Repeat
MTAESQPDQDIVMYLHKFNPSSKGGQMNRHRRSIAIVSIILGLTLPISGIPPFSDWAAPVNIGIPVNSAGQEFVGSISKDGRSLFFQRGVNIDEELWVARRSANDASWEAVERLPDTVNSTFNDRAARISPDGHWLVFASNRPGGLGGYDIWTCWRANKHDDFAWQPAMNVGAPVNSAADEIGPTVWNDDDRGTTFLYFSSSRPGGLGATDIYASEWGVTGFEEPALVAELSSVLRDESAFVRRDGRELFLQSNRDGTGIHIWVSTRATTDAAWSAPEKAAGVNSTTGLEVTPALSWDGRALFFASNRSGSAASDIYVAGRTKLHGKP